MIGEVLSKGQQPRGVRKNEFDASDYLSRLKQTIVTYNKESCYQALIVIIALYKELRDIHSFEGFVINSQAEHIVLDYLERVMVMD